MGSGDSKLRFRKAVIQLTTKTQVSLRLKGRWSAAFKVPAGSRWTQMWTLNQFQLKSLTFIQKYVFYSLSSMAHHFIHVVKMFDLVNKSLKCWPERVSVTAGEFKLLLPVRLHLHQIDSAPNKRIWVFKDSKMNWLTSTMFWFKLVLQPRKCRFLPVYFQSSSWMRITLLTLWPLWCPAARRSLRRCLLGSVLGRRLHHRPGHLRSGSSRGDPGRQGGISLKSGNPLLQGELVKWGGSKSRKKSWSITAERGIFQ